MGHDHIGPQPLCDRALLAIVDLVRAATPRATTHRAVVATAAAAAAGRDHVALRPQCDSAAAAAPLPPLPGADHIALRPQYDSAPPGGCRPGPGCRHGRCCGRCGRCRCGRCCRGHSRRFRAPTASRCVQPTCDRAIPADDDRVSPVWALTTTGFRFGRCFLFGRELGRCSIEVCRPWREFVRFRARLANHRATSINLGRRLPALGRHRPLPDATQIRSTSGKSGPTTRHRPTSTSGRLRPSLLRVRPSSGGFGLLRDKLSTNFGGAVGQSLKNFSNSGQELPNYWADQGRRLSTAARAQHGEHAVNRRVCILGPTLVCSISRLPMLVQTVANTRTDGGSRVRLSHLGALGLHGNRPASAAVASKETWRVRLSVSSSRRGRKFLAGRGYETECAHVQHACTI